ncbi:MAG: DUF423 domain-containing protein [Gammaproteobacteria bacterium]
MNLSKVFHLAAALLGLSGVIAGAVGSHMVQPGLSDVDSAIYDTALVYLFVHVLALMAVATMLRFGATGWPLKLAGFSFCFGTLLFSGTILVRLIFDIRAPIYFAPTGGSLLMLAWGALALAAFGEWTNKS